MVEGDGDNHVWQDVPLSGLVPRLNPRHTSVPFPSRLLSIPLCSGCSSSAMPYPSFLPTFLIPVVLILRLINPVSKFPCFLQVCLLSHFRLVILLCSSLTFNLPPQPFFHFSTVFSVSFLFSSPLILFCFPLYPSPPPFLNYPPLFLLLLSTIPLPPGIRPRPSSCSVHGIDCFPGLLPAICPSSSTFASSSLPLFSFRQPPFPFIIQNPLL